MGNLVDGRVNLDNVKYLPENRVPDDLLLSHGDVLFNRTNSADLVGKVGVFDQRARVSFASYLLRLRVKSSAGSGYWLSYLLNTSTLQRTLRATATIGVSQVNIKETEEPVVDDRPAATFGRTSRYCRDIGFGMDEGWG